MSTAQKRKRSDILDGNDEHPTKRNSAACTECRKQKIKCEIKSHQLPCSRCRRRGLSCALHTDRRQAVADTRQAHLLNQDLESIHSSLRLICQHLQLQAPQTLVSIGTGTFPTIAEDVNNAGSDVDDACELSPPASPSVAQAPIDTYLTSAHGVSTPGERPARARRRESEKLDLISKGVLSLEIAGRLVEDYLRRFDRFLYGIASRYHNLGEVRRASPALLAAMCAVSSFHESTSGELFEACNKEFRTLVSASLFEKRDVEYIRALCIASFWLSDASRILISDAARRAADCRLHRNALSIVYCDNFAAVSTGVTSNQQESRDKARLWYLLYVCDQHLAILHNRDSILSSEKDAIEMREHFLGTPALNDDVRLISQVSLLVIMGQIKTAFGSEQSKPLSKSASTQLLHFGRELDHWFAEWSPRFELDEQIGGFPLAGLTMHYQFARLYLAHHVFRGLKDEPIPRHFVNSARTAREAAVTIFIMLVENDNFQSNIVGMPHYFHIMISFAAQFLIELCTKYHEQLGLEVQDDLHKVSAALELFARTSTRPQHPIARVTTVLMRKLNECTEKLGIASVLAASPFDTYYHAAAKGITTHQPDTFGHGSSTAPDTMSGFPNDFMFADFADFSFPGLVTLPSPSEIPPSFDPELRR